MTMTKKIILWSLGLVAILAVLIGLAYWGQKSSNPDVTTINPEISVIKDDDQTVGDKTSKVVLVEYGDFQCPACGAYQPTVDQVLKDYGSKIVFVFRHFPLNQVHKNAQLASQASEAAGKQGKFWEFHDILYAHQTEWSNLGDVTEKFTEYAKSLGLNEAQFKTDMKSSAAKDRVDRDENEGIRYGVDSTPTFYLNGKKLTLNSFNGLIDAVKQATE